MLECNLIFVHSKHVTLFSSFVCLYDPRFFVNKTSVYMCVCLLILGSPRRFRWEG